MKCHFTYVGKLRVWIPGCYSGIYSEGYCACRVEEIRQKKEWKESQPELKLKQENKELWRENARLHRIIKKLTK